MIRVFIASVVVVFLYAVSVFACPSGQSCPAGKDCVSDPTQCVADSSSSSSGSSTEPTTTKDQLGLVLDVDQIHPMVDFAPTEDLAGFHSTPPLDTSLPLPKEIMWHFVDAGNASNPEPSDWLWGTEVDSKF